MYETFLATLTVIAITAQPLFLAYFLLYNSYTLLLIALWAR